MNKFKVGDKVRHITTPTREISRSDITYFLKEFGEGPHTVTKVNADGSVVLDNTVYAKVPGRFELVNSDRIAVGDRVEFISQTGAGNSRSIKGDTGVVVEVDSPAYDNQIIGVKTDRGVTYRTYTSRWKKIAPVTPATNNILKAGTRVESYTQRSSEATKKATRAVGTLVSDLDLATVGYHSIVKITIDEPSNGFQAGNMISVWGGGVKALPTAVKGAKKTWIVIVTNKFGGLEPATSPREYTSREQADAVAKSMAQKHEGQTFLVFESVGAATAVPPEPVTPMVAFTSL